jgi:hypothetical protein
MASKDATRTNRSFPVQLPHINSGEISHKGSVSRNDPSIYSRLILVRQNPISHLVFSMMGWAPFASAPLRASGSTVAG